MRLLWLIVFALASAASARQADEHGQHHDHQMQLDATGVVMNSNDSRLPRDCQTISTDHRFRVVAGAQYATRPGAIFGLSEHQLRVEPCSRVTVEFVNEDGIRHQWMVHGLPRYLYPGGMFHLEAAGGHARTGTFIVPGDHHTYLIHCDMAQHMEKGMKGQLVVGKGSGDLWNVPGVSADFRRFDYLPPLSPWAVALIALAGFFAALWALAGSRDG